MKKLKKYMALTRAGVLETLAFRISVVVTLLGNITYLIIVFFLWKSIYAEENIIGGMTFSEVLIYIVLATAMFNFMDMAVVWVMGKNIQDGKIVLDLLKPIGYQRYLFWSFSGNFIMQFTLTFLPTFIAVFILTSGTITLGTNLLYFVISIIMAIVINFNIDFIVGTICVYTESIWGINIMKQVVVLFLSGATIPISFFPEKLKMVVYYLPFQSIYNAPLTILINNDMVKRNLIVTLGMQLMWCIVTIILSKSFWKISLRKITVNGG